MSSKDNATVASSVKNEPTFLAPASSEDTNDNIPTLSAECQADMLATNDERLEPSAVTDSATELSVQSISIAPTSCKSDQVKGEDDVQDLGEAKFSGSGENSITQQMSAGSCERSFQAVYRPATIDTILPNAYQITYSGDKALVSFASDGGHVPPAEVPLDFRRALLGDPVEATSSAADTAAATPDRQARAECALYEHLRQPSAWMSLLGSDGIQCLEQARDAASTCHDTAKSAQSAALLGCMNSLLEDRQRFRDFETEVRSSSDPVRVENLKSEMAAFAYIASQASPGKQAVWAKCLEKIDSM